MSPKSDTEKLESLQKRLAALSEADQLRAAAGVLDEGSIHLGEVIARQAVERLAAKRLLGGS